MFLAYHLVQDRETIIRVVGQAYILIRQMVTKYKSWPLATTYLITIVKNAPDKGVLAQLAGAVEYTDCFSAER